MKRCASSDSPSYARNTATETRAKRHQVFDAPTADHLGQAAASLEVLLLDLMLFLLGPVLGCVSDKAFHRQSGPSCKQPMSRPDGVVSLQRGALASLQRQRRHDILKRKRGRESSELPVRHRLPSDATLSLPTRSPFKDSGGALDSTGLCKDPDNSSRVRFLSAPLKLACTCLRSLDASWKLQVSCSYQGRQSALDSHSLEMCIWALSMWSS